MVQGAPTPRSARVSGSFGYRGHASAPAGEGGDRGGRRGELRDLRGRVAGVRVEGVRGNAGCGRVGAAPGAHQPSSRILHVPEKVAKFREPTLVNPGTIRTFTKFRYMPFCIVRSLRYSDTGHEIIFIKYIFNAPNRNLGYPSRLTDHQFRSMWTMFHILTVSTDRFYQ
eukprot:SAG31_NODE_6407_length_2031_cov_1.229814_1_plen_169_part_00